MKNHTCRRGLSLLLAVCMALSMTNSFVYAQAGEEPANIVQQDTAEEADSSRDSSPALDNTPVKIEEAKDQPAPNSSSGLPVDSEKAETPEPPAPPTCSCPAADSGEVAHSEDCPLYRKPDEPAQEKKCTCAALCTEDAVDAECPVCAEHWESCAFTEEQPEEKCTCTALCTEGAVDEACPVCAEHWENCACLPEQSEAAKAALALIAALPTVEELQAEILAAYEADTPDEAAAAARMDEVRAQAEAARATFDALSDEEKAAFDPEALAKLAALETMFSVTTLADGERIPLTDDVTKLELGGYYSISNDAQYQHFMNLISANNPEASSIHTEIGTGATVYLETSLYAGAGIGGPIGGSIIDSSSTPVRFNGTFDGQGHSVNLNINGGIYSGMFGALGGKAVVQNVVVTGKVNGGGYTGGIVGKAFGGTIQNCVSLAEVSGAGNVGGIAGSARNIKNCASGGSVTGTGEAVGGIVGSIGGALDHCYSTGTVSGARYVGGVAGVRGSETVGYLYALGEKVTGAQDVGRVLGGTSSGGTPEGPFYARADLLFGAAGSERTIASGTGVSDTGIHGESIEVPKEGAQKVSAVVNLGSSGWSYGDDGLFTYGVKLPLPTTTGGGTLGAIRPTLPGSYREPDNRPEQLTLEPSAVTMAVGKSRDIMALTKSDDQKVENREDSWTTKSNNESIIKLDGFFEQCTIYAKAVGTDTVTAKANDGQTASCVVTVVEAPTRVTLDQSSLTLNAGDTGTLKATVDGTTYKEVVWSSDDEGVVIVDENGKVTARAGGTTWITAASALDDKVYARCTVTVRPHASGVTLNKTAMSIERTRSEFLTATVKPNGAADKTVSWASSDESVATVTANGNVTGVALGEATITVTTNDGGHTASCLVTVTELCTCALNNLQLTGTDPIIIPVDAPSATREIVGKAVYASTDECPAHPERTISYSCEIENNTAGATLEGNILTVTQAGEVTVQVTATAQPSEKTKSAQATITVTKAKPVEAAPNIGIDYVAEILTGFAEGGSYTVNGSPATLDGATLAIDESWFGQTLSIVKKGGDTTDDSAPQSLTVPARPAAPATPTGGEGEITGVDGTMEYRLSTASAWTAVPQGATALSLAQGAYRVRVKAVDGASFASPAKEVIVAAIPDMKITVTLDGQSVQGASLADAVRRSGLTASAIKQLTVTAGEITAEDWKGFATADANAANKTLPALTDFIVEDAVESVADIPNHNTNLFPATIRRVRIPKVKVIGESAFYECKALESADFPDATAIYGNAFFRCGNLKEASFPAVTTIRDMAFWYCEKFDSLTLGATPPAAPNGHRPFDETLPEFRFLHFVGADGAPLSGETLEAVQKAYDDVAGSNGNVAGDGLWYGWTVRASEITIDKAVQTVSYSGKARAFAVKPTPGGVTGFTVTYRQNGAKTTPIAAGTYDVTVARAAESTHPALEETIPGGLVVSPAVPTLAWPATSQTIQEGGSITPPSVTLVNGESYSAAQNGEITYAYKPRTASIASFFRGLFSDGYTGGLPTAPGEYLVRAGLAARGNYADAATATDLQLTIEETPADAITVKVNGSQPVGGDDLEKAVAASGVGLDKITALEIAAGEITADDWTWFTEKRESLTALASFEAAGSVTAAPIPNVGNLNGNNGVFPGSIVSVKLPGLTAIGNGTFMYCKELTTVEMPEVTQIGMKAFAYCEKLTEAAFPQVEVLPQYAFAYCNALEKIDFSGLKAVGQGAFMNCKALKEVSLPELTTLQAATNDSAVNLFRGCTALQTISMPKAGSVSNSMFYGCTALTVVSFPQATTIGISAFHGCSNLAEASFPKATNIDSDAFYACTKLATLKLPADPPTVSDSEVFRGCASKRSLTLLGTDGNTLTGDALAAAQAAYDGVTENGNAAGDGRWYGWLVGEPKITIGETVQTATYSGGGWTFTVTPTPSGVTGFTVTYQQDGTPVASPTNAGTYDVTVSRPADSTYAAFEKTISGGLVINPATPTLTWPAESQTISVGGSITPPGVTLVNGETYSADVNGEIVYAYKPKTATVASFFRSLFSDGYTVGLPTAAGEYLVRAGLAAMGNYAEASTETDLQLTITEAPADKITITLDGGSASGASLEEAVTKSGREAATVKALTVTAGELTADDWTWFQGKFSALTGFTVAEGVTAADIPAGEVNLPVFPTTIQRVHAAGVKTVGGRAFTGCLRLTTASFPDATTLGQNAFYCCTALTGASFPKVTKVSADAFNGCGRLSTVDFSAATIIDIRAFQDCETLTAPVFPAAKYIGNSAFLNCDGLTTPSFPVAASIGANGFKGCTKLTAPVFGDVTDIGASAFYNCGKLVDASFPQVLAISNNTFYNCTSLVSASFPGAKQVNSYAFEDCRNLETISFPEAITIGSNAFKGCNALASAAFPKANFIGDGAFENCAALKTLTLGAARPTSVSATAFTGCPDDRKLALVGADGAVLADDDAAWASYKAAGDGDTTDSYWYGWKLPAKDLPAAKIAITLDGGSAGGASLEGAVANSGKDVAGVKTLTVTAGELIAGDWAWFKENFTALTDFTVAEGVTVADIPSDKIFPSSLERVFIPQAIKIGNDAFGNCNGLSYASFPRVTKIGNKVFGSGAQLKTLRLGAIPPAVSYDTAFEGCPAERSLVLVDADDQELSSEALAAAQKAYISCYDENPFDHRWYGWKVTEPAPTAITIKVNGGNPVEGANLNDAVFNSGGADKVATLEVLSGEITAFDWKNFHSPYTYDQNALKSFSVAPEVKVEKEMGSAKFSNSALESVSIPQAVAIGDVAFINCSHLSSVTIPEATSIGGQAFRDCAALTSADFPKAASIESGAFMGCGALATVTLSSATELKTDTFEKCTQLTAVKLPQITRIWSDAFEGCTSLASISLPAAPPTASKSSFSGCPSPRAITFVDAGGAPLTGSALKAARASYKAVADGNTDDDLWYGWTIGSGDSAGTGGDLTAPLTQDKVDGVFGPGHATLDGTTNPPTITINNDVVVDETIVVKAGVDVVIDLGGNTITGKPGVSPVIIIESGADVTIKGPGSVNGVDGENKPGGTGGNGGDGIQVDGSLTVDDGADINGGAGGSGDVGGNGGDAITGSGNITINGGSATGGDGGSGAGGNGGNGGDGASSTGSGTVDVGTDGSAAGGNGGNSTGGNGTGGAGGNGTQTSAGGSTTVNGETNGGNGGSGSGTGGGGNGGNGTVIDGGTAGGNGSATGDDGGGVPEDGTGNPGTGGQGVSGGDAGDVASTPGSTGVSGSVITITVQPADKTVAANGSADFTVEATASGGKTLIYQWYQMLGDKPNPSKDTPLTNAKTFTANDKNYTGIRSTIYQFYCVLSANGAESVTTRVATLTVSNETSGLTAPLTQEKVDNAFGPGNATLRPDGTIKIEKDVTLDDPIRVETDVTIDLGGHTINGANGQNGSDGKPSFVVVGDHTLTIIGGGTISGGDGGDNPGGTGGDGAPGVDLGSDGNISVDDGAITGGDGGSGSTGGNGGNGVTGGGGSDVEIGTGGSASGGNGGDGSTGAGGNGGDGTSTGGSTVVNGETTGGNGGSGSTTGGDGGNGSTSAGSGSIDVGTGGNATGGDGGNGTGNGGGGNGGNGTETGGSTTVGGNTAGGSGGMGSGTGNGGDGGDGTVIGGGAAGGNGSATGGDGGNIPGDGTGNPGAAGEGISGGDGGNVNNTPGKAGFKVTAIVDDTKAGTTVTAPEKDLADAVITQEDIDNNRNVKVELIVEKRDDQPDKTLVEQTLGGTKADTIGVYFEITLEKTVTESGTTKPTETITESHQPIEITITIPDDMRGGSNYVVIRVHDGSAVALPTTQSENKLIFQTDKFSTYAIAYTPGGTTPPAPPHGGGSHGSNGGSSPDNDQYEFWMGVKDKINGARDGDVVKVNAHGYDKMPWSVMDALRENSGVNLVITWNGKTITIPANMAQKNESGRIYWPLSKLAELYAGIAESTVLNPAAETNPETGGPGKYIPVTGGVLYEVTAPAAEPVRPSIPGQAVRLQPDVPETMTPPDAGFQADVYAGTPDARMAEHSVNGISLAIAAVILMILAGYGVWTWKKKKS